MHLSLLAAGNITVSRVQAISSSITQWSLPLESMAKTKELVTYMTFKRTSIEASFRNSQSLSSRILTLVLELDRVEVQNRIIMISC